MGVAGCGKSTIGRKAAQILQVPFLEGDDFHSAANVAKMKSGVALTDQDRMPWVDAMVDACNVAQSNKAEETIILACSALSETVRSRLKKGLTGDCHFVHLHGEAALLRQRLAQRKGHFFKPDLLQSQFEALELPQGGTTLDAGLSIDEVTKQLCAVIQSKNYTQEAGHHKPCDANHS